MAGIGHRGFMGRNKGVTPCSLDTDAFVTATGISGANETALRALAAGIEADGLCEKIYAFYPIIGGNASAHSYNLKDTTQFQINWSGTLTHDANGSKSNGTDGYGDTTIQLESFLNATLGDEGYGWSVFAKESFNSLKSSYGDQSFGAGEGLTLIPRSSGNISVRFRAVFLSTSNANSIGFYTSQFPLFSATANVLVYKNGSQIINTTANIPSAGADAGVLFLATNISGTPTRFMDFYHTNLIFHKPLTPTEAANLYSRISTFETAIGR